MTSSEQAGASVVEEITGADNGAGGDYRDDLGDHMDDGSAGACMRRRRGWNG